MQLRLRVDVNILVFGSTSLPACLTAEDEAVDFAWPAGKKTLLAAPQESDGVEF